MNSNSTDSVTYLSFQMAKLYKALGPRVVKSLRSGNRIDALAGQFELDPVHITTDGINWLRAAESLVAETDRESISLDDLTLAFEATHEPSDAGWCERATVQLWESRPYTHKIMDNTPCFSNIQIPISTGRTNKTI